MAVETTPAILLKRVEYGDFDYIVTLLTLDFGKVSAIAKNAKKSVKRFSGVLELFSVLNCVIRKGKGMPLLQEASIDEPFGAIRTDYLRTAYASYWSELMIGWLEEEKEESSLYRLLGNSLAALDRREIPPETVSILFQLRFMEQSGFLPDLDRCAACGKALEKLPGTMVYFDLVKGGLVCSGCPSTGPMRRVAVSKGTVKLLLWLSRSRPERAGRVTMPPYAVKEGLNLLEGFTAYYLGREPKSLGVLRAVRGYAARRG